ncbi:MAG: DUF1016 N-terminal domain-containing protein [Candidatus Aceula meridiana]|nr:DUF1016 N-terminal domain-containing protein [Candidatus Aceula meridiana]
MPAKALSTLTYKTLLTALQKQLAISQENIQRQLVITYWSAGKNIDGYLKKNPKSYLAALTRRLSKDLKIHERTLQQCHQFFSVYPRLDFKVPITWSHYRVLLSIDSEKERGYWQKRIIKEDLNQKELLVLLQEKGAIKNGAPKGKLPKPTRGLLYHYRLVKASYVDGEKESILVDCGFENRIVAPAHDGTLTNKRIVRCERQEDAYQIKMTRDVTTKDIYTFKAHVERVIDADTLLSNVDCGFGIWSRQRLRLKGIDAPEIATVAGIRAKQFVENALQSCHLVIAKTYKSDKYDRYLADIFFAPHEANPHAVAKTGTYLNQLLLDKGLASLY